MFNLTLDTLHHQQTVQGVVMMISGFNIERMKGFTLVELMIVIAIAAILASLAVPSFSSFINNTNQTSAFSQLQGDLNRARSEAIKRNARVLVCNSTTGTSCSADTDWSSGWVVCFDGDANNDCDATTTSNPNPQVKRSALKGSLTLNVTASPIRFNPVGTASGSFTFTLSGNWDGAQDKSLTVSPTGNISR